MKKTKLFTTLAAFVLVLGLGACDTSSGSTDSGATSEETSESTEGGTTEGGTTETVELSNYTLSIGITYQDELEKVPEYATAYIEGGWDSWAQFVALTPSEDGRYEYTFASIAPGTYEYQLVLAYKDEEPGWTYRITQDGVNASFTVKEEDGDNYKNEVTVTALSAIEDIIPDPSTFKRNVKIKFDIVSGEDSLGTLSYASLRIIGSFDSWTNWYECSVDENGYYYVFETLSPIEYEYNACLYYTDETLADGYYDYKVNASNQKLTISADLASSGATVEAKIEFDTKEGERSSLEDILSAKSVGELGKSITLYFTFTYNETPETIPDYEQIYLNGGWDDDSWNVTKTLEYDETSNQYCVEITYGNDEDVSSHWFKFNLILEYSDAAFAWDDDSIVLLGEEGQYWTHESGEATASYTVELTDSFTNLLGERGEVAVTYIITIGNLGAAPEGIVLYAAGDFNGTWNDTDTGWYDWGDPVALTNNGDGTYNLVLYELPESGRSFEILADDTTDESQDMWGYILGNHTFTADEAAGTSVNITITTTYTDWNETATGVFPPKGDTLEEFYVILYDNSSYSGWTDTHTITFNAQGNYWNSQTSSSCSGTKSALASGKIALYSEAAYALSGTNSWFNVKVDNATMNIAASTLPSNESGTPVYVNYGWFDGWVGTSYTWNANDAGAGTWYYLSSGQTIADFVTNLTIS